MRSWVFRRPFQYPHQRKPAWKAVVAIPEFTLEQRETVHFSARFDLASGGTFRVRLQRVAGADTLYVVRDASSIMVDGPV